jgi:hypothetical protein
VGPFASTLDSLVPGASGAFVAQVVEVSEHDARGIDGDLYQSVKLRVLRSSGLTLDDLYLVRAGSEMISAMKMATKPDHRPPPEPPARFRVGPDALQQGRTYWFAKASELDRRYPQEIAGIWPAESTSAVRVVDGAIATDAYAWHPQTWRGGYVTGWRLEGDSLRTQLRVWLRGRLFMERRLEGELDPGYYERWHVFLGREMAAVRPPGCDEAGYYLVAACRTELNGSNAFQLVPGRYKVLHVFELKTGHEVAAQALNDVASQIERVFQAYDGQGRMIYERVHDFLPRGGKSVGNDTENWLRLYERWIDPQTGKTVRESVSRHDIRSPSGLIQVDLAAGLASGPLRR